MVSSKNILKSQYNAVWQSNVIPMYFRRVLLQRLICEWLSCVDGFVVQRMESLVVLKDVATTGAKTLISSAAET